MLTMIPKPGASSGTAKDVRPITLLPLLGKASEKIIVGRLQWVLQAKNEMSPNQYGFIRGRSTESAIRRAIQVIEAARARKRYCVAISFDITGALDCIQWHLIESGLRAKYIPEYLVNCVMPH